MVKNVIKVLILVLCLALLSFDAYAAYDDGDFQIWNTNGQDVKMGKATKLTLEGDKDISLYIG